MANIPTSLSQYYGSQGKALPATSADRFADPDFATAAKTAGYTPESYAVNGQNADANNKILSALLAGKGAPTPTPVPTIGSTYNIPTIPTVNPDITAARSAADTYYTNSLNGTPNFDESQVRADAIKAMQAEIDASNSLYANKLSEARVQGASRLGQNTAIQARRGELGSDFGAAATDTVNQGNSNVYSGIDAERNAAVQAILSKANDTATQQIKDKNDALKAGLDEHIKYLEDAATRADTNAKSAAQYIYDSGVDLSTLTPDQLSKTATGYGVSADAIKTAYVDVKKAGEAAKTKAEQDAAIAKKQTQTTLGEGQVLYDADGKIIAKGPPKTFAPKGTAETANDALASYSSIFVPGATYKGAAVIDNNGYINPAAWKDAISDATSKKVSRTNFIKQYGALAYIDPNAPTNAYGLSPAEVKQIEGTLPYNQ